MLDENSIKDIDSILSQIDAKKLLEDKEFVDELSKAETYEKVVELFKTRGVILSFEQVQEIVKRGEKLNETDLENITGGINKKAVIGGAIVGLTILAGLAGFGGGFIADGEDKRKKDLKRFEESSKQIMRAREELKEIKASQE